MEIGLALIAGSLLVLLAVFLFGRVEERLRDRADRGGQHDALGTAARRGDA